MIPDIPGPGMRNLLIQAGADGRIAIQPGVGTLIFADPEPIDEAIYQCLAKNAGGTALSVKVNLRQASKFIKIQF